MVVAPYNAQVLRLRAGLPTGVRVGTVDKFQGQEAPIVFFSMATSSGEDVPAASRSSSPATASTWPSPALSASRSWCAPASPRSALQSIEEMQLVTRSAAWSSTRGAEAYPAPTAAFRISAPRPLAVARRRQLHELLARQHCRVRAQRRRLPHRGGAAACAATRAAFRGADPAASISIP